ncbi:hypothetical protein ABIF93_003319 [Bradyrhizobium japonicum]
MEILIPAPTNAPVKATLVNWLPWSVLKISGVPYVASASSRAATQNETSIVFDNRHARTARLAQGGYTFAAKIATRKMPLPEVHLAIGNRFTQFKGAAAAYAAFADATAEQLYTAFRNNLSRFSSRKKLPTTKKQFISQYVSELRDFNTAGVVAAHHGTPLSKMRQDYYPVHNDPDVKVNKSQLVAGLQAVDSVVSALDP